MNVSNVFSHAAVAFLAAISAARFSNGQSFHAIEIPSSPFHFHQPVASVLDVSPDGSRVAGAIIENGVTYECDGRCTLPFIWTVSGGTDIQGLLGRIELYTTEHRAVSLPAEEVVGVTAEAALMNGFGGYYSEPSLFADGHHNLLREVGTESQALLGTAISDDARVVAGSIRDHDRRWHPVRWMQESGLKAIDVGRPTALFTAISGNGRVLAGASGGDIHNLYAEAFRWSENEGATFLDSLHPRGGSSPTDVSEDGSVIVGTARGDQGFRAYRWTSDQGTIPLELPAGFAANSADGVTADGGIVVGRLMVTDRQGLGGTLGWGPSGIDFLSAEPVHTAAQSHAMIWDSLHGTRLLKDLLVSDYGLADELAGWSLVSASAISARGNVIAGVGVNPLGEFQGWVVVIPEPDTLMLAATMLAIAALSGPLGRHRRVALLTCSQ